MNERLLRNTFFLIKLNYKLQFGFYSSILEGISIDSVMCSWKEVAFSNLSRAPTLSIWTPCPLCVCFFKLNFNGTVVGNLGPSGIGGIIRGHSFSSILSLFGPSGFCFVDEAKMIALRTGLRQIASLSLSNIIAEGDSFCAI